MAYSPFKMKGHTLPGIKQSPAKETTPTSTGTWDKVKSMGAAVRDNILAVDQAGNKIASAYRENKKAYRDAAKKSTGKKLSKSAKSPAKCPLVAMAAPLVAKAVGGAVGGAMAEKKQ